jgi:enoyl-CoA hydratase/carnithine racemase
MTLTLNRPEVGNAFSGAMVDALFEIFSDLMGRDDIRVVVLEGAGKHFCSGLDLVDGGWGFNERSVGMLLGVQRRIGRLYLAMRRCPQAIIATVQGAAYGGGLSLAAAADLRVADSTAKFCAAYIRIGLTGADMASSYLLPRLVGGSFAAVAALVTDLLATAPLGLRLTKEAVHLGIDSSSMEATMALEDRHQTLLSMTDDAAEAMHAFQERRAPEYKGR